MSTADHILDQIDNALHDYDVSDDAMRSRPEPEPVAFGGFTPTVQIMDEAGEWQDLGVASAEIHITTAPELEEFAQRWADFVERLQARRREEARQARAAFEAFGRAYAQAMKPAMEAVAQGFAEIQKAMQHVPEAVGCNDCGQPAPPRDRPAWQSPYGPARRRR